MPALTEETEMTVDENQMPIRAWLGYSKAMGAYLVYPPRSLGGIRKSYSVAKFGLVEAWTEACLYLDSIGAPAIHSGLRSRCRPDIYMLPGVYVRFGSSGRAAFIQIQNLSADGKRTKTQSISLLQNSLRSAVEDAVAIRLKTSPRPVGVPEISEADWVLYMDWAFRHTRGARTSGPLIPDGWARHQGEKGVWMRRRPHGIDGERISTPVADPWGTILLVIEALKRDQYVRDLECPDWCPRAPSRVSAF